MTVLQARATLTILVPFERDRSIALAINTKVLSLLGLWDRNSLDVVVHAAVRTRYEAGGARLRQLFQLGWQLILY